MTSHTAHDTVRSLHVMTCKSALGRVLVASSEAGIAAILLGDDEAGLRADLARRFPGAALLGPDDQARHAAATVVDAIGTDGASDGAPDPALPHPRRTSEAMPSLDLRGTEFQRAVWEALRAIPRGRTATYTEIATRIGRPSAVRAVAQACAANAHAILVPCHRVVRSDGGLSGYRWGVERKRTLLREEGALPR